MTRTLTAVLIRENEGFVALCPELDVASQGESVEEAKANLREAVELFFECASEEEVKDRFASEFYVSSLEVRDRNAGANHHPSDCTAVSAAASSGAG
jgi:predicted RNase H-like HicB family nuclease